VTYVYRCEQCRTTSRPVADRAAAEGERVRHHLLAHGTHVPDDERIEYRGAGLQAHSWRWLGWVAAGGAVAAAWNWVADHR
jgi:hypothetical protein